MKKLNIIAAKMGRFNGRFWFWEGVIMCFLSVVGLFLLLVTTKIMLYPYIALFFGGLFIAGIIFILLGIKFFNMSDSLDP